MNASGESDIVADSRRFKHAFFSALAFAGLLWAIKLFEIVAGLELTEFGIRPRSTGELTGILFAPLIHGSLRHLTANSAPIVVLGTAILYGYPKAARVALPVIYLGTGICVWLFARPVYHIGASSLTFGMMFFVFTIGALRWDRRAIALAMIVFFLYGGMIWGVFPIKAGVSFESHLFGALTGIALAVILRDADPAPPAKRYSWELEDADNDDDFC